MSGYQIQFSFGCILGLCSFLIIINSGGGGGSRSLFGLVFFIISIWFDDEEKIPEKKRDRYGVCVNFFLNHHQHQQHRHSKIC